MIGFWSFMSLFSVGSIHICKTSKYDSSRVQHNSKGIPNWLFMVGFRYVGLGRCWQLFHCTDLTQKYYENGVARIPTLWMVSIILNLPQSESVNICLPNIFLIFHACICPSVIGWKSLGFRINIYFQTASVGIIFSWPGQRPCELLPSLGFRRRRPHCLLTIFQKSSPLTLLDQLEPNLVWMFLGVSCTKVVFWFLICEKNMANVTKNKT